MPPSATPPPAATSPSEVLAERLLPARRLGMRDLAFRAYLGVVFGPVAVIWGEQAVVAVVAVLALELPLTGAAAGAATALTAAACAAVLLLAANTGAWRAPIAISEGDVQWLLSSPLPRTTVLRPRLERAAVRAGGWGAASGAVSGTVLAQVFGGPVLRSAAAAAFGGITLGLLGLAVAWWSVLEVGRAARALRAVTLAGGLLVAVSALAMVLPAARLALAWSGPWGWVAAAVAAGGGGLARVIVPLAASAVVAAVALRAVLRSAPAAAPEELARRAAYATRAAAAGYLLDSTALAEARRDALDAIRPASQLALPAPRRAVLAVPWRDATALLRAPGRTLTALTGMAAGGLAAAAVTATPLAAAAPGTAARALGAAAAAALIGQVAVGQLLGPLRAALTWPFGHAHLPWDHAGLVRRHLVVPLGAAVLTGAAGVLAVAVATGSVGALWAAPAVVLTAPLLVLSAATRAMQPPPAPDAMVSAAFDESAALRRALESWPQALVLLAIMAPAAAALSGALGWQGALLTGGAVAAAATGLAWWRLRRRTAPWGEDEAA